MNLSSVRSRACTLLLSAACTLRESRSLGAGVALRFNVVGELPNVARGADDHADRNLDAEDLFEQD